MRGVEKRRGKITRKPVISTLQYNLVQRSLLQDLGTHSNKKICISIDNFHLPLQGIRLGVWYVPSLSTPRARELAFIMLCHLVNPFLSRGLFLVHGSTNWWCLQNAPMVQFPDRPHSYWWYFLVLSLGKNDLNGVNLL